MPEQPTAQRIARSRSGLAVFVRPTDRPGEHPRDLLWPMSLLSGAALARQAGWQATVIDFRAEPRAEADPARRIGDHRADLVLMDVESPAVGWALETAERLRERRPDLGIWALGQHATARPGDLLFAGSPFAGCLDGESELALSELLAGRRPLAGVHVFDPEAGRVQALGNGRQVEDLDALPLISPQGLDLDRYVMRSVHVPSPRAQRWGFLLTSRGCPYRCLFCSPTLRQSFGHSFRAHSPERVAEDLARLKRDHGITAFYLADDVFTLDRERVLGICEIIQRRRLRVWFAIQTRADRLDREVLRALKGAGCFAVKVGLESGVDRILSILGKGTTRQAGLEACRAIRAAGLQLTACYLLGNPTETLAEMEETYRFAREVRADMIQVAVHTPYPGSESHRRFVQPGTDWSELDHYATPGVTLSEVSQAQLRREQRRFYRRYYLAPDRLLCYLRRRAPHRLFSADEWRLLAQTVRFIGHDLLG